MSESVSVDKALSKGQYMVNYPVMVIMFATIGCCYYLIENKYIHDWTIGLGFFACIALPWLYWSFMVTKWRLWAFEKVTDVHELKRRAIDEKLIWPDGSIVEKTEIRTSTDRAKLLQLNKRFTADVKKIQ